MRIRSLLRAPAPNVARPPAAHPSPRTQGGERHELIRATPCTRGHRDTTSSGGGDPTLALRRSALVGGVIALLVASSSPATSIAARSSAAGTESAATGIAWKGCGDRLECARVRVPLDWANPSGPRISLALIRHLASKPERRIGSLFFNPGGPGGSVDRVRETGAELDALAGGRFDIVGWDIRGAGESRRVKCFSSATSLSSFFDGWSLPTTLQGAPAYVAKAAALARRCGRWSGSLLEHMSTKDTAQDLDHFRALVGDQQLTYLGISGGTMIGQTYANMFPQRVRAMVLDGVVDPAAYVAGTVEGFESQLSYTDRAFAGFLSLCQRAGPTRCALAGHGSVQLRVYRLLAQLGRQPIPAPSASPPGVATYTDALSAIVVALSSGPARGPIWQRRSRPRRTETDRASRT